MYNQVAQYLTTRGCLSTRGKPLSAKVVEQMYKSSLRKEEREGAVDVSIGDLRVVMSLPFTCHVYVDWFTVTGEIPV